MERKLGWILVFLVLATMPAWAANEGVCNALIGETPALYGLCVAFCEAQQCDPDEGAADPFADCPPASPQLLDLYNARKQAGDPDMPCVQSGGGGESCPCFTQAQSDAIPTPYSQCLIDWEFGTEQYTNIIYMENGQQLAGVGVTESEFGSSCVYHNSLADPPIFFSLATNAGQATACHQIIENTIAANSDECQLLCDPVCPP
jgi:hypothetical protein